MSIPYPTNETYNEAYILYGLSQLKKKYGIKLDMKCIISINLNTANRIVLYSFDQFIKYKNKNKYDNYYNHRITSY